MLRELSVQNLALIEDVRVELEGGYCAWTGETGAGKSLLLDRPGTGAGRQGVGGHDPIGQDRSTCGGGLRCR